MAGAGNNVLTASPAISTATGAPYVPRRSPYNVVMDEQKYPAQAFASIAVVLKHVAPPAVVISVNCVYIRSAISRMLRFSVRSPFGKRMVEKCNRDVCVCYKIMDHAKKKSVKNSSHVTNKEYHIYLHCFALADPTPPFFL